MDTQYCAPSPYPAPTPAHLALSPSADDSPRRIAVDGAPLYPCNVLGLPAYRDPALVRLAADICANGRASLDVLAALTELALRADELLGALVQREMRNPTVSGAPLRLADGTIARALDELRVAAGGAV